MKDSWKIVIGMFLVAGVIAWAVLSSHPRRISRWVEARGEVVKNIDHRTFRTGPFWFDKNTSVYRVETDKGIYWYRFGLWNTIKQEIGEDKYVDVND